MTHVLHVAAYFAPAFRYGGPPRSIHGLCRALRAHGVDVEVFATDADGAGRLPSTVVEAREYDGVPVRYFPRSWPSTPIGSRALTRALRETVSSLTCVHIHGLWNRVVWSAAREARRAGVPYVVSPRGMLLAAARAHHGWRKRLSLAAMDRTVLQGAALLHATSEEEAEALEGMRFGPRVAIVPNGVDVRRVREPRDGTDPAVIAFVGRLHPLKRVDLVIDAFCRVRRDHPQVRLALAGPDEYGMRPSLEARAGPDADAIAWLGAIDEVRRDTLLREASALVLCSNSESFGMSVLEAMAVGTPVVVTTTCGWRDVETHRAGYRVDQRADAIAEALSRVLASPGEARAMGLRGRALVESRYAWPQVARSMATEYVRVGSSGSPATSRAHASASL